MRKIKSTKIYEATVVFQTPTTEHDFKNSTLYNDIMNFIKVNDLLLYYEYYQSFYDPEIDEEYDIVNDPDFYDFRFLLRKDADAVAKQFGIKVNVYDNGGEFYYVWPPEEVEEDPRIPVNWNGDMDELPGYR